MLRRMMFAGLKNVTVPPVSGRTVKINLCDPSLTMNDIAWNDEYTGKGSAALTDSTGAATPWTFLELTSGHDADVGSPSALVDADFPLKSINSNWNRFGGLMFKVAGLNTATTYTIKTMAYYGGDIAGTDLSFNGSAVQSYMPMFNPTKLTFSNIAPNASGEIIANVAISAGGDYSLLSALIIIEN